MMKLKNLEQKRMDMQDELGFADMSAEEMLEALEKQGCEEVGKLRSMFKNLRDTVIQIRELNKISTEFAKKNLKFIELMAQQDSGEGSDGVYGAQGSKETRPGHTLEKMI